MRENCSLKIITLSPESIVRISMITHARAEQQQQQCVYFTFSARELENEPLFSPILKDVIGSALVSRGNRRYIDISILGFEFCYYHREDRDSLGPDATRVGKFRAIFRHYVIEL